MQAEISTLVKDKIFQITKLVNLFDKIETDWLNITEITMFFQLNLCNKNSLHWETTDWYFAQNRQNTNYVITLCYWLCHIFLFYWRP